MMTVDLRVMGKTTVAEGVVSLSLAHPQGKRLPDWTPGSHVDLVLPGGLVRQYSLCGDRWDAYTYRIGVLREPVSRGGSAYVHGCLAVGDMVSIGGPRNNFPLVPAQRYLFVAGGIGITPLLPMVRAAELLGADWQLLYGGRASTSMAFLDELAEYGDRVVVRRQERHGHLDRWLRRPDPGAKVYCCGPAPLLAAIEQRCAGWPAGLLRTERFIPRDQGVPVRSEPFEVELVRSGLAVTVGPDQSVLAALARAGVSVLSSCRQGICGTCETAVLAGQPDHRDSILDDAERASAQSMFICVSRSRTDRLVLDL